MTAEIPAPDANIDNNKQIKIALIAHQRLADIGELGTSKEEDAGMASYRWLVNYKIMQTAVRVVLEHGSKLPEQIQADLHLKFLKMFKDLDNIQNTWSPVILEDAKRQLLSEAEEQKRKEQAKAQALAKVREEEHLEMIMDTDAPPNDSTPKQPVPTREDLYNMALQLQKQIKFIDDRIFSLENKEKCQDQD
jgi:hypothetical protein